MSYVDKFLSFKCAGDVLNAAGPIRAGAKEISEAMAVIHALRPIVLAEPMKYGLIDLCAGNALGSLIAVHLLPIAYAVAVDRREHSWHNRTCPKRFIYVQRDIRADLTMEPGDNTPFGIISIHPCQLAERVIEIYNRSAASWLVLMPCCAGDVKTHLPAFIEQKLGRYDRWCVHLYEMVEGSKRMRRDNGCTSPCNVVLVARK